MTSAYIVMTDLDGTLLDHHDYSWHEAAQAIQLLKDRHIPLVMCSSKTAWEMITLRQELGNEEPFVAENGAAIYIPGNDEHKILAFGLARAEILTTLDRLREEIGLHFRGFHDMSIQEVMKATGLDHCAAQYACRREYTEPLLWQDTPEKLELFRKRLEDAGMDVVAGGRFLHVSAGCDKGRAVSCLRKYYAKQFGAEIRVIALGDSDNDVPMLESADLPVLVRSPVKAFPPLNHQQVYRTQAYGPVGWNEAILALLTDPPN